MSFGTVIFLIKVILRNMHQLCLCPLKSVGLSLMAAPTNPPPSHPFSRPPPVGVACPAFPSWEARGACTHIALGGTCEFPVMSSAVVQLQATASKTCPQIPVPLTHVNTREHAWRRGLPLPLPSPCWVL